MPIQTKDLSETSYTLIENKTFSETNDTCLSELSTEAASSRGLSASLCEIYPPEKIGLLARKNRGWGPRYQPPINDEEARQKYRQICDSIKEEIRILKELIVNGVLVDEASGVIAEIQALLEELYNLPFGEDESLKKVVVVLRSQLNNIQWTQQLVDFLDCSIQELSVRYKIDELAVDQIADLIEEKGLDLFRGTVSDSDFRTRYRILPIDES